MKIQGKIWQIRKIAVILHPHFVRVPCFGSKKALHEDAKMFNNLKNQKQKKHDYRTRKRW